MECRGNRRKHSLSDFQARSCVAEKVALETLTRSGKAGKIRPEKKGAKSRVVRHLGALGSQRGLQADDEDEEGGWEGGEGGDEGGPWAGTLKEETAGGYETRDMGRVMRLTKGGRREVSARIDGPKPLASDRVTWHGHAFHVSVYRLEGGAGVMVLARDLAREERIDYQLAIDAYDLKSYGLHALCEAVTADQLSSTGTPRLQQQDARRLLRMVTLGKTEHQGFQLVVMQQRRSLTRGDSSRGSSRSVSSTGTNGSSNQRRGSRAGGSLLPATKPSAATGIKRGYTGVLKPADDGFVVVQRPGSSAGPTRLEPVARASTAGGGGSRTTTLLQQRRQYGAFEFNVVIDLQHDGPPALLVRVENLSQDKSQTSTMAAAQVGGVTASNGRQALGVVGSAVHELHTLVPCCKSQTFTMAATQVGWARCNG